MQFKSSFKVLYVVVTSVNADCLVECYSYFKNVLGYMCCRTDKTAVAEAINQVLPLVLYRLTLINIIFQSLMMMIAQCHHTCQYRVSAGQRHSRRKTRKDEARIAANSSNLCKDIRDISCIKMNGVCSIACSGG